MLQCSRFFFVSAVDNVPDAPVFTLEPPVYLTLVDTVGSLVKCSAVGRPAPVMDWIWADGSPVDDVPGLIRMHADNSLEFLAFHDDKAMFDSDIHNGRLRCTASNDAGVIVSRQMQVHTGEEYFHLDQTNLKTNCILF